MLIQQMLELQRSLNDDTNGKIWLTGKTKENREINWNRCIYMEAVEALDSFNWKHWKDINANDDMENIKVEIIDIWHFIMSEVIFKEYKITEKYNTNPINFNREKLILSLEKLVYLSSSYQNIDKIIIEFFNCLNFAGMSTNELYKRYVIKNQLNKFRQDNGYKDGSYKKVWNGLEDNIIAFEIMEKSIDITPENLYLRLQKIYKNL